MSRIKRRDFYIFCLCVLSSFAMTMAQEKCTLLVEVAGAKPNQGQIILSVFNSPDTYMKKPLIGRKKSVDSNGRTTFEISDLDTGIYSVSAFYDEDGNGELKTGFMGIPTEKVAFSNNAKGLFGPPSFKKTSFSLDSKRTIKIKLVNAKN